MDKKQSSNSNSENESIGSAMGGNEIVKTKKHLLKKRLTTVERKKIEKERKARQIRRLRKGLMPKNAIVTLHELQGPGMTKFVITSVGNSTKAEIVMNNVTYEATGQSKNQAKARVSEKALRDLVISRMAPSMNEIELDVPCKMDADESDDLSMVHVAAFALHKLFAEWKEAGFEIPSLNPAKVKIATTSVEAGSGGIAPKFVKTVANLPPDAANRHPTTLLNHMRPQVLYQDLGSDGEAANREYTVRINVDEKEFIGHGRSKKLARMAASRAACEALFAVEFDSSVLQGYGSVHC